MSCVEAELIVSAAPIAASQEATSCEGVVGVELLQPRPHQLHDGDCAGGGSVRAEKASAVHHVAFMLGEGAACLSEELTCEEDEADHEEPVS